jgi:hypothetical protein
MRMSLFAVEGREEVRRRAAWDAATPIYGSEDRQDCDGRRMCWAEFGHKSARGWFIGYSIPLDFGGLDHTLNLRARHWKGD